MFAPLRDHDEQIIGLFDLYNPEDGLLPTPETLQMLEIFANVTAVALENARHWESLQRLAITDGLTGLYNHRHFQEVLAVETERAKRYENVFSVLMMDLDFFKGVNDRLGHLRGDEALREVAEVLNSVARSSNFVARYGGEEFVMILPETTGAKASAVAERIRAGVRGVGLEVADPPVLTISIGIADFPACGTDRESLIAAADAALLFAKHAGRDMVAYFSDISPLDLDMRALEGLAFRLESADIKTLEALASAVDARDAFDKRHSASVVKTVEQVIGSLPLDEHQGEMVRAAARIYDVGKLAIPLDVLNRKGRLGQDDKVMIREHPMVGKRLIESAMKLSYLMPVVLHHHERWDGSGYPDGLKGEETPLAARVIAICDAYQAMIAERPYRAAMTQGQAFAELRREAGLQFDPVLVEAFVESVETADALG